MALREVWVELWLRTTKNVNNLWGELHTQKIVWVLKTKLTKIWLKPVSRSAEHFWIFMVLISIDLYRHLCLHSNTFKPFLSQPQLKSSQVKRLYCHSSHVQYTVKQDNIPPRQDHGATYDRQSTQDYIKCNVQKLQQKNPKPVFISTYSSFHVIWHAAKSNPLWLHKTGFSQKGCLGSECFVRLLGSLAFDVSNSDNSHCLAVD